MDVGPDGWMLLPGAGPTQKGGAAGGGQWIPRGRQLNGVRMIPKESPSTG